MKNEIYYQLIIYNFRYKFIKNDAYILYINYDIFRVFSFKVILSKRELLFKEIVIKIHFLETC